MTINHLDYDRREHGVKPPEGTLEYNVAEARALLAESRKKHVFEREQAAFATLHNGKRKELRDTH